MDQTHYIGIDLGGTFIKGGILDSQGEIVNKHKAPTQIESGPEGVSENILALIEDLLERSNIDKSLIRGIGIGIPGQATDDGIVVFAPNLGWHNFPLGKRLERIGIPIFMDNDANLAALAEKWQGAGTDSKNMVMVTVGTGIGTGIVIHGKLYSGTCGTAGELGHTVVDPKGPLCSCGRHGCLETFCSAKAMVRRSNELMQEGASTVLADKTELDARDILDAAEQGDTVGKQVLDEAIFYLGLGLANIVNILNPDRIVVGGGISEAGAIFFEPLRKTILDQSFKSPGAAVSIVPAELGNDAGIIGAVKLAIDMMT